MKNNCKPKTDIIMTYSELNFDGFNVQPSLSKTLTDEGYCSFIVFTSETDYFLQEIGIVEDEYSEEFEDASLNVFESEFQASNYYETQGKVIPFKSLEEVEKFMKFNNLPLGY